MGKKDWEQRLKEKWDLWNYNKELGNYTTCENEVIDFIKNLLSERERKVLEHVLMEVKEEDLVDKAVEDYIEGWLYKLKLNKKK